MWGVIRMSVSDRDEEHGGSCSWDGTTSKKGRAFQGVESKGLKGARQRREYDRMEPPPVSPHAVSGTTSFRKKDE